METLSVTDDYDDVVNKTQSIYDDDGNHFININIQLLLLSLRGSLSLLSLTVLKIWSILKPSFS